jgi:hypothetical protein
MVVFRDEAGRLQRRQRDDLVDGPPVHGDGFYRLYLARNHLPPWFLRGGHVGMLDDDEEARLLGVRLPADMEEVEPTVPVEQQRVQHRRMLRATHVAGGGIVDPVQIPAGVGHWEWLDAGDREVAEANGFGHSFEDVTNARGAGALSLNPDRQDVPSIVWYPDPRWFNPSSQPAGPGHWAFLTTGNDVHSDQGFASLNLGGTSGMTNFPTASQIFRLRQQYRAQGREDLTADMNVVWIPGDEKDSDTEGADPVLQPLVPDDGAGLFVSGTTPEASEGPRQEAPEESGPEEAQGSVQEEAQEAQPAHGILGRGISASDFDPTNGNPGGITDQTARLYNPRYYTFRIGGRIVTLDRARPRVGKPEEHKTCVFTKTGWQQHSGHIELDWTNHDAVSSLARWRDQATKRHGWPELRTEPRVVYPDDEKAWITAEVHRDLDAGRDYDIAKTNLGFQKLFGYRRKRTETGIGSIMLRIKREWKKARVASALMSGHLDEEGEEQDDEEAALAAAEMDALEREKRRRMRRGRGWWRRGAWWSRIARRTGNRAAAEKGVVLLLTSRVASSRIQGTISTDTAESGLQGTHYIPLNNIFKRATGLYQDCGFCPSSVIVYYLL